ncbi:hypothetical protein [Candidatus Bathycorpusculum sp.]|nr:hypothetical protein [Candidatus Termitimicrobium sp.]MCL2685501.1 hypothetical protein [Candidatus Termitimicrobium sp.]
MITKLPLELDPPSPFPAPPLRKRPFISPQINADFAIASSTRLFIDKRWN